MYKFHNKDERPFKGKDITGMKFGRLTVLRLHHYYRHKCKRHNGRWIVSQRMPVWECLCECGNKTLSYYSGLKYGGIMSCGCLTKEKLSLLKTLHGQSMSPIYKRWSEMWTRCTNPKRDFWHRYGGRGIKVCDRWKDFRNFEKDMGKTFKESLLLDRIDNNGPYSPENCKWSTNIEQANNTCNSRFIEHNGKRQTVAQWAREINVSPFTIYTRLRKGWNTSDILMTITTKI